MKLCLKHRPKLIFIPLLISVAFVVFVQSANTIQAQEVEIRRDERVLQEIIEESTSSESESKTAVFEDALVLGNEATKEAESAYTRADWERVSQKWLIAISHLQEASQDTSQRDEALKKILEYQEKLNYSVQQLLTSSQGGGGMIEALPDNITPAYQEKRTQYDIWILDHRRNTFRLSLYSSIAIFLLVVIVVMAGIYLSYLQLVKGLSSETKVAIKEGSFEVSSSIIGFLILFLSLAFFYLYLREVYPVHEIGTTTENSVNSTNEN